METTKNTTEMKNLTKEQIMSIDVEFLNTSRKLNKELSISHDLRHNDICYMYIKHLRHLKELKDSGVWNAPVFN